MPSVQQERTTVMSSTCCAMFGYQSETHRPLCPCCLKVRFDGISPLFEVPGMAVNFGRIESGSGCPRVPAAWAWGRTDRRGSGRLP